MLDNFWLWRVFDFKLLEKGNWLELSVIDFNEFLVRPIKESYFCRVLSLIDAIGANHDHRLVR